MDSHGDGLEIIGPHRLEIWGDDIHLGANVHIQTAKGKCRGFALGPMPMAGAGKIIIGDNVLLTPGLHIVSAASIEIGDAVMIAVFTYPMQIGTISMTAPLRPALPRQLPLSAMSGWAKGEIVQRGADW